MTEYASFRADSTLGPVAVTLRTRPPAVTSCPFGFLAVPAWNTTMLLLAKGRSVISSPAEGFSGYSLDARTTTTDADLEDSGNGVLSELVATALRCANSPPFTSGIIPLASGSPKRA